MIRITDVFIWVTMSIWLILSTIFLWWMVAGGDFLDTWIIGFGMWAAFGLTWIVLSGIKFWRYK